MQTCPHCGCALCAVRDAFCPECHEALDELPQAPREGRPEFVQRTIKFGIALIVLMVVWQVTYWLLWAFGAFDLQR
jgi:uncharacterized paraquat-inducible protein A